MISPFLLWWIYSIAQLTVQLYVESKRKKIEVIRKQYSQAEIVDVTSFIRSTVGKV
ncbi:MULTISPECIES: hypothetical protein [unclassified Microcoleus]|uniref:hypothetical protein n=1 Tax=unclassified Microcoleus TaxID=2642155 RepID=UPI002FD360C8